MSAESGEAAGATRGRKNRASSGAVRVRRARAPAQALRAPHAPTEQVEQRHASIEHIAEAAYYLAEKRGFAPGQELDDWLTAEAQLAPGTAGTLS